MTGLVLASVETQAVRVSSKTLWVFLRAEDSDGYVGWGEATIAEPAMHPGLAAAIQRLAVRLIGHRFDAPIDLPHYLGSDDGPAGLPEAAAQSAMDQALTDIAARRAGVPIAAWLGASARDRLALYANINRRTLDRTPAGFAASARTAAAAGYTAFKIAPFDGLTPAIASTAAGRNLIDAGIARAAATRDAIGAEAQLMIDCHWRLTEAAAVDILAATSGLTLHWLECAVPETRENFAGMRRIREAANAAGVLTAGCETMIGVDGFAPFLSAGVYDVIMPDVKYAGGIRELMRVAERAAAAGVTCSLHNPSGPICHAHSIQVSAAIGGEARLEHQFDESPLFVDLVAGLPHDFVRPDVAWRGAAGLGIGLDAAVVAAHREIWPPTNAADPR